MRGGYSGDLNKLRGELLRLASLLELELDFSEEDVTFADRAELTALIEEISARTEELINSFALGNAIKEGIGVAIIGSPNAGKSTLLNTLLNEDRAMVSDIAGTTRDVIEERITLGGVEFRFIDTAGIRASDYALERMGIERTFKAVDRARIILYLFDVHALTTSEPHDADIAGAAKDAATEDVGARTAAAKIISAISAINTAAEQQLCILLNKCDPDSDGESHWQQLAEELERSTERRVIPISAKYGYNIEELTRYLSSRVDADPIYSGATIVSNSRHYDALLQTHVALRHALAGLSANIPADLAVQDIREALHWLGTITGEITTDEILSTIFSKFCIGK
jgi:tRNA modification GTPase